MRKNPLPFVLISLLLLNGLACKALSPKLSATEAPQRKAVKLATATGAPAGTVEVTPVQVPEAGQGEMPVEETAVPTATHETASLPTDIPASQAQTLVVSDPWFAHDSQSNTLVWYAFFIENPNPDLAVVDTQFQVVGYDDSGAVLATASLDVPVIFPGERLALGGYSSLNVPEDTQVDNIEIQATREGQARTFEFRGSPFKVDKVSYIYDEYRSIATGLIQNQAEDGTLTNLAVTAVAFDENDKIIGVGNNSWVPFVLAGGSVGVVIDMHMSTEEVPARLEFYPTLSNGWQVLLPAEQGPAAVVTSAGFSQTDYGIVNYAFLARNPSDGEAIQYAQYQATAFDAEGMVVGVSTGSASLLFPQESQGFAGIMSTPENVEVARVEVAFAPQPADQYDSWKLDQLDLTENPLTAESTKFFADPYNPKVTGIIKNGYGKEVNANVVIVAYNAAGEIIGGGTTFVTLPANGQAAIEVYVQVEEEPDKIEVYPSLSNPPSE